MSGANFDVTPPVDVSYYDKSIRYFCPGYEEIFKISCAVLKSILSETARVLIAGAGTGMEISIFGRNNPGWKFTGVDPSEDMLKIAETRINNEKINSSVELIKGYTDHLPDEMMFDAATSILVMHFMKDDGTREKYLESISRRLKKGAPFLLVDGFGSMESTSFRTNLSAWKTYAQMQGAKREIVEEAFSNTILKMVNFVPEERLMQLLDGAGFKETSRFYSGFQYGGWVSFKD